MPNVKLEVKVLNKAGQVISPAGDQTKDKQKDSNTGADAGDE
jgi:hypothetical protein